MSETTEYLLVTTVVAFALAAFVLWFVDLLYTDRTGKPASERIREREQRAKGPLTKSQFRLQLGFYIFIGLFGSAALLFSRDFEYWRKVMPSAWILFSAIRIWEITRKWRRQNVSQAQSSEAAT